MPIVPRNKVFANESAPPFPAPLPRKVLRQFPELVGWEKKNAELLVVIRNNLHITAGSDLEMMDTKPHDLYKTVLA